jgi:hypothetical protein
MMFMDRKRLLAAYVSKKVVLKIEKKSRAACMHKFRVRGGAAGVGGGLPAWA